MNSIPDVAEESGSPAYFVLTAQNMRESHFFRSTPQAIERVVVGGVPVYLYQFG